MAERKKISELKTIIQHQQAKIDNLENLLSFIKKEDDRLRKKVNREDKLLKILTEI